MQAIRQAFSKLKGRLFWLQWVGNFLLMLLAAGWLQIPDSHSWQFVFSILSGVLLVVGFMWLYIATFRHLLPCASRPPWWLSCLLLAVFIALWWLLLQLIGALRAHEALYAGYWNSQSPPWLRHHLGHSSLVAWQERSYDCIQCVLAGLLLPAAMVMCACGVDRIKQVTRVYRHWFYWLCVLVFGLGAPTLTWAIAEWTPEAGLVEQTISAVLRLGLAYTVDILLWCYLLALVAQYLSAPSPPESRAASKP
jgi:hypothetical protein